MKKTITLVSASLFALSVIAQKGTWYCGGSVGFSISNDKQNENGVSTDIGKGTTWNFSPEFGTFLTNHVQIGLAASIGGVKGEGNLFDPRVTRNNYYGATLYSRYFFGTQQFKPFIGVNVSGLPGTRKLTTPLVSSESKTFTFNANLNGGFGYALSKKVTVVGSFGFLGFTSSTEKPTIGTTKYTSTSFGLNASTLGNRFNIGFYYTFHQ